MSQGRILAIDDSEAVLSRMRDVLTAAGYEVITTTQTVGNARHLPTCDLVIIDFHMPGIDGGDVVKALRSAATSARCAFYLYTSDDKIADDYARLGFDGSFKHKGDEQALVAQVGAAFRMKKLSQLASSRPGGPTSKR